tara:strand:+ start:80 stop:451 length:372 start_codon:yes stop_codon:yes gene_type:complete
MRKKIFLSLIFLSLLPTKVFSSELKNQYFCRILGEEVGQNIFNRNQKYIPNWIKPFINEELIVKEIVFNTLLDEVVIKNQKILTNSKCLFLLTLEEFADEYVSKKYEIKVIEEFNKQINNFSF